MPKLKNLQLQRLKIPQPQLRIKTPQLKKIPHTATNLAQPNKYIFILKNVKPSRQPPVVRIISRDIELDIASQHNLKRAGLKLLFHLECSQPSPSVRALGSSSNGVGWGGGGGLEAIGIDVCFQMDCTFYDSILSFLLVS